MIKKMALASITMQTERSMKESGNKGGRMDMASGHWKMDRFRRSSGVMVRRLRRFEQID